MIEALNTETPLIFEPPLSLVCGYTRGKQRRHFYFAISLMAYFQVLFSQP